MVVARIRFTDVLDTRPVAGVSVDASLFAVGSWTPPTVATTVDDGPSTSISDKPLSAIRVDELVGTVASVSTADGEVSLNWSAPAVRAALDKVRALIANKPNAAAKVKAEVLVRCRVESLDHRFTLHHRALLEDEEINEAIVYDFAYSCVGHTTAGDSRIWFALTSSPLAGAIYKVRVFPAISPRTKPRPVAEVAAVLSNRTATVLVTGLAPRSSYSYTVVRTGGPPGGERVLARGSFRTLDPSSNQLRLAFASCHHYGDQERLRALASQSRDALFLIGDQIYGDRACKEFEASSNRTAADARRHYEAAYARTWRFPAFRECLRSGPVYMMLDDHDIADDWGTGFTARSKPALVAGALEAYRDWQHSHNPSTAAGRYHYDLNFGNVAVFALDARSQRGLDRDHPVLGGAQAADFARWATTVATAADVAVVISPVPLAFAPARTVQQIADAVQSAARDAFAVGAGLLGGYLGGLFGAGIGYYLGGELYDLIGDEGWEALVESIADVDVELRNGRILEPDIEDQWVTRDNRTDLAFVVKHLFDLANDVAGGGARQRAVVVLCGDVHVGMVHKIESTDPAHAAQPTIVQFTSSPVSHSPFPKELVSVLEKGPDHSPSLDFPAPFTASMTFSPVAIAETNFGMLTITRTDSARRTYRIEGQIRAKNASMPFDWIAELDGPAPPRPTRPRPRS